VDSKLAYSFHARSGARQALEFGNVLNEVAASIVVSGASYLAVFSRGQLDALDMLFVRLHAQGLHIVAVFWGVVVVPVWVARDAM
jgi:hypothetical protein